MVRPTKAKYDPSSPAFVPIERGIYPAHITKLSESLVKKTGRMPSDGMAFDLQYKVAEEVKEQTQQIFEMDGFEYKLKDGQRIPILDDDKHQRYVQCTHMVGREFRDVRSTWLFEDGSPSGRNGRYFKLLKVLGVKTEDVDEDGKIVKQLVIIEQDDVLGLPVNIDVRRHTWTNKDGQKGVGWRVFSIYPWEEGYKLSPEEISADLPF